MIRRLFFIILIHWTAIQGACGQGAYPSVDSLAREFAAAYRTLDIPWMDFDYQSYLRAIPAVPELEKREDFFRKYRRALAGITPERLPAAEKTTLAHLRYQIDLHLERCALEKKIRSQGQFAITGEGLYKIPEGRELYRLYIRYATGVNISPDEVFEYGMQEIAKIHREMAAIRRRAGFEKDSSGWVNHLNNPAFFLTDRDSVVAGYEKIKERVLAHIGAQYEQVPGAVPDIDFMTWPNAGPYTPPGIYLSPDDNAYGKAVYQFNFYGNRHNRRAMDWLFLHEAIPGHHFHRYVRENTPQDALNGLWFAGATVEGWATYVEYFGAEMGLYRDDMAWLGKWEWDLVRSARIVLSVGIHDRGWSKTDALAFWKANIANQDDIAEREITRCINWPAQVLTYKIGAKKIFELRETAARREGAAFDLKKFHTRFLSAGYLPLEVMAGII
jgi:uncharacterized protein (DUF885 family)